MKNWIRFRRNRGVPRAAVATATAAAMMGVVLVAAPASAASAQSGYEGAYIGGLLEGTASTFKVGGQRAVCIEHNYVEPTKLSGKSIDKKHPHTAYVLSEYLTKTKGTSSLTSKNAANNLSAAVYAYVNVSKQSPDGDMLITGNQDRVDANWAAVKAKFPGANTKLKQIKDDAKLNAGPYSADTLQLTGAGVPTTGHVTGVGVRSAAGYWQEGYPITVELEGPGVFTETGTATWTGTTADEPLSLDWYATGKGQVGVTQHITDLPATTVTVWENKGTQSVVTTGEPSAVLYGDPISMPTSVDYSPKTTSKTSVVVASEAGTSVFDEVKITEGRPGSRVTGTSTLYGRLSPSPSSVPRLLPRHPWWARPRSRRRWMTRVKRRLSPRLLSSLRRAITCGWNRWKVHPKVSPQHGRRLRAGLVNLPKPRSSTRRRH